MENGKIRRDTRPSDTKKTFHADKKEMQEEEEEGETINKNALVERQVVFLCYTFQPQSGGISLVMIFRGCGGT
jgi:hypothetical protein